MKIVKDRQICKECKENRVGLLNCNGCSNRLFLKRTIKLVILLTIVTIIRLIVQ